MLTGAGLLESEREQYYQNYKLKPALLEQTLQQIIASGLEGFTQSSDPFRSKTLRDFFKHGRLQQIPV